jgi:chemotaxis signal transduction protein
MEVGIIVDRVLRIAGVRPSQIHEPLSTLERFKREFVRGELPVEEGLMVVLDLPTVIRSSRQRDQAEPTQEPG